MELHEKLAFTTTSLARPDILDATYKSFSEGLYNIDLSKATLFINIDPLPDSTTVQETMVVASEYFGDVFSNSPEEPNFTKAVNWCWESAKDFPYIFHLEDDWLLNANVDLRGVVDHMDKNPHLIQTIFRAYTYRYVKAVLSPSVMRNSFFSAFAGQFKFDTNPEVQLRRAEVLPIDGSILHTLGETPIVSDIGREWLKERGMVKPEKGKFVRY